MDWNAVTGKDLDPSAAGSLKVCFVHIPKTAGTSLARRLESHFSSDEICPVRRLSDLDQIRPVEVSRYRLWHGHFGVGDVAPFLGSGWRYVSLLRDPVDRVASLYNYWRSIDAAAIASIPESATNYLGVHRALSATSLLDFVSTSEPTILREISNSQCRYLSSSLRGTAGNAERAVETIEQLGMAIGTVEQLQNDGPELLATVLGSSSPDPLERLNQTRSRPPTEQEVEAIWSLNEQDLLLHQHFARPGPKANPTRAGENSVGAVGFEDGGNGAQENR